ncbi:MAG: transketolase [Saccharofermentanales bacterium]|jgi:transketolase
MSNNLVNELQEFAAEIRLETVKAMANLGFGHLGGSLSIVDALAVLYGYEMRYDPENPQWEDRDLCIVSKGHAGPALYATLALKGFFPPDWLKTLNKPGTRLPSHCDRQLTPGVDMTTGSLGQGVSTAIGMTLGNQLANKDSYTYLFVGDGEANEGQVWEGAMFTGQQKLDHMIWFIDYNKKQLDGYMKDIVDIAPVADKFKAFNFHVQEIDGHDISAILEAIRKCKETAEKPHCIILDTIKGKGIPELEELLLNHHVRLTEDFSRRAISYLQEHLNSIRGNE